MHSAPQVLTEMPHQGSSHEMFDEMPLEDDTTEQAEQVRFEVLVALMGDAQEMRTCHPASTRVSVYCSK